MSKTLELTQKLIACQSVTPDDAGCQEIIASYLTAMGFEIESFDFATVQNLWARKGRQQPLLTFVGHTDVVPVGKLAAWDHDPFIPTIQDGYLYGRGAADMKGGIAAMIIATQNFLAKYPQHHGSLSFLITSDEEGPAVNGTVKVLETLLQRNEQFTWCLVGEPTCESIIGDCIKVGRRGSITGDLKIIGKQGHIAHPHKAINPIHSFVPALNELISIEWDQGNQYFPPTSFQISNIYSGTGAHNVIPAELSCIFNLRYSNELTAEQIMQKVTTVLDKHNLNYTLTWEQSGLPFLSESGNLRTIVQQAIKEIARIEPQLSTNGGTSDARFFVPTGAQIVELGLCNASIHAVNECVKISDLDILTSLYERILEMLFMESN
jgi:succinyl-diaminopimelate desuccinylase